MFQHKYMIQLQDIVILSQDIAFEHNKICHTQHILKIKIKQKENLQMMYAHLLL